MENWRLSWNDWSRAYTSVLKLQGNEFESLQVHEQGLALGRWYESATNDKAAKRELDMLRHLGRIQLSKLNGIPLDTVNDMWYKQVFDVLVITAPLDAANYKQPHLSLTRFSKVGSITSWGLVIIIMNVSQDYNNLNVLKRLAATVPPVHKLAFLSIVNNARTFLSEANEVTDVKTFWESKGLWSKDAENLQKFLDELDILIIDPKGFVFKVISEKAFEAQTNWQEGYAFWSQEWNKLRSTVIPAHVHDVSRPKAGIKFASWAESIFKSDNSSLAEIKNQLLNIQRLSGQQLFRLPAFPSEERDYVNNQGAAEAGNIVCLIAPMLAVLYKYDPYNKTTNRFQHVDITNWGGVLAILQAMKETRFTYVLDDFASGNRAPYSEKDLDYIISEARQFYNNAQNSPDRLGLSEEDLESFALLAGVLAEEK